MLEVRAVYPCDREGDTRLFRQNVSNSYCIKKDFTQILQSTLREFTNVRYNIITTNTDKKLDVKMCKNFRQCNMEEKQ